MPEAAAPAASPAPAPPAPASAPAAAPATPATDPRGAPPRGHKWAAPTQTAPAPVAGKAHVPSQPRTPQQISTGEPAKAAPKAHQPTPQKVEGAPQRTPHLIKHKLADGTEVDVDISEHVERVLASEKRKVKVNGQEREYSIGEAFERLPLAEGAHQRFREAHELEQRAKQMEAQLRKGLEPLRDPKQALSILAKIHGPEQAQRMMEEHLASIYAREQMPPEQRRAIEEREAATRTIESERAKLQREKSEWEAQRSAEAKQKADAATNAEFERMKRDFPILLQNAKLPSTPRMMARLAQAMSEAHALKIPYTDQQIADHLAKEWREEIGHYGEHADPEELRTSLGKGADRIREAEVKRVMDQPGRGRPMVAKGQGKVPDTIRTPDQLRKFLREQDMAAERRRR